MGEHRIRLAKAPFSHLGQGPAEREWMLNIKRLFDPNGILNPWKMGLEK